MGDTEKKLSWYRNLFIWIPKLFNFLKKSTPNQIDNNDMTANSTWKRRKSSCGSAGGPKKEKKPDGDSASQPNEEATKPTLLEGTDESEEFSLNVQTSSSEKNNSLMTTEQNIAGLPSASESQTTSSNIRHSDSNLGLPSDQTSPLVQDDHSVQSSRFEQDAFYDSKCLSVEQGSSRENRELSICGPSDSGINNDLEQSNNRHVRNNHTFTTDNCDDSSDQVDDQNVRDVYPSTDDEQQPQQDHRNQQSDGVVIQTAEEPKVTINAVDLQINKTGKLLRMASHFKNDDLKIKKDRMKKNEYIDLVLSKAREFEARIDEAVKFDFMGFFVVEENLNQFVGFLDATNTEGNDELTRQKIEVISYIGRLQMKLDQKRSK